MLEDCFDQNKFVGLAAETINLLEESNLNLSKFAASLWQIAIVDGLLKSHFELKYSTLNSETSIGSIKFPLPHFSEGWVMQYSYKLPSS